jgi:hypothetical protein
VVVAAAAELPGSASRDAEFGLAGDCVTGFAEVTAGVAVCGDDVTAAGLRGVGNSIGVTATIIAVSNSAIESLLSIYGTGSNPPGRKG